MVGSWRARQSRKARRQPASRQALSLGAGVCAEPEWVQVLVEHRKHIQGLRCQVGF